MARSSHTMTIISLEFNLFWSHYYYYRHAQVQLFPFLQRSSASLWVFDLKLVLSCESLLYM